MKRNLVVIASATLASAALLPLGVGAAKKPASRGGSLTIASSPNPVVWGRTTAISGRLSGAASAGRRVTLQSDPYPFSAFGNAGTTTTTSAGSYAFAATPLENTRYRVRRQGTFSPVVTVLVRFRASLRLSDSTPRRAQRVRFAGQVCPSHDGALVSVQRRTRTRRWRTVGRTRLRAPRAVTPVGQAPACRPSVYAKRLRIGRSGRFRVVVAADAAHARGISGSRVARVH